MKNSLFSGSSQPMLKTNRTGRKEASGSKEQDTEKSSTAVLEKKLATQSANQQFSFPV
jgi:hypothetical protein